VSHRVFRFSLLLAGMVQIRLPDPPVPFTERKLSLAQIASRWRRPVSHVRLILLQGGVRLVDVERSPAEGAYLADLEEFERKVRNGEET
jgi:hypothetical protein